MKQQGKNKISVRMADGALSIPKNNTNSHV